MPPNKCERVFESASKSTILTSIPVIISILVGILIIVLSIMQSFSIVKNPPITPGPGNSFEDGWKDLCKNELIQYLTPFHVEVGSSYYGCQWRSRNTIFRSLVISLCIVTSIISLVVIFAGKWRGVWPILYWIFWIGFVMMFVVFILDCDAINSGFNSCLNKFEVEGYNIVEFYNVNDYSIITDYSCHIYPFVYTAICDLVASLMLFCAYKVASYYILDPTERKASIVTSTKASIGNGNSKNTATQSNQTSVVMATNNTKNNGKKEDSPDPFAEYQGGYEVENANTSQNTGGNNTMSAYDE